MHGSAPGGGNGEITHVMMIPVVVVESVAFTANVDHSSQYITWPIWTSQIRTYKCCHYSLVEFIRRYFHFLALFVPQTMERVGSRGFPCTGG